MDGVVNMIREKRIMVDAFTRILKALWMSWKAKGRRRWAGNEDGAEGRADPYESVWEVGE